MDCLEELSEPAQYIVLSRRQTEVLRCIWDGLPSKSICETLGMSRKTLEFHRGNLMRNWRCANIMQVIRLALRQGLLEVEEFFVSYNKQRKRTFKIKEVGGPTKAIQFLNVGRCSFKKAQN